MSRDRERLARRAAGGDLDAAKRLVRELEEAGRLASQPPELSASSSSPRALEDAVRLMIDRVFASTPSGWAALAAEHADDAAADMPAHGTVWRVKDSGFESWIRGLMRPVGPGTVAEADEAVEERALEIDKQDYVDEDGDLEEDSYIEAVREAWRDRGMDRSDEVALLGFAGWERVGDTGFFAREIDGHLVLGVHGYGYNFLDQHWIPLYRAFGLRWHEQG